MNKNMPATSNTPKKTTRKPDLRRLLLIPAILLLLTIPWLLLLGTTKEPASLLQFLPRETAKDAAGSTAYPQLFPPEGSFDYPQEGEYIGSLSISSIGFHAQITEGDKKNPLEASASHPVKSPLPGEGARVLIDAESSFSIKSISRANEGDQVIFKTYYGTYTYIVKDMFRFHMDDASYQDSAGKKEELLIYVPAAGSSSADGANAANQDATDQDVASQNATGQDATGDTSSTDSAIHAGNAGSTGPYYAILCRLSDGKEVQWK